MGRRGDFSMVIVGKAIVIVGRKYRSKWWGVECPGCPSSRRRKDGSCKHERIILENLAPSIRSMARLVRPVDAGEQK